MDKPDLAAPQERWTRIDEYLGALARRRTARRSRRRSAARTQPEVPQLMLSTLPFAALMSVMAILVVAFMFAALPGSYPKARPSAAAQQQERGTAKPGWFDSAKREFR